MNIYAIHDGNEMLHGGCLGCGYLIVVVYQVKSGHRRHCDGQAKGVPPRRHGRGPRPMGPLRSVRVVGKANQMPMSLRRGSQTESTTALVPLSLFLLIATIHGRILRRGLPLPLPSTLPLPPLCSAAVVSCCFLLAVAVPLQLIHTTTSFSLLFCSRPSALSLLRQLELRGASFASTRDVTSASSSSPPAWYSITVLLPDLTIASRRAIHLDIAILI